VSIETRLEPTVDATWAATLATKEDLALTGALIIADVREPLSIAVALSLAIAVKESVVATPVSLVGVSTPVLAVSDSVGVGPSVVVKESVAATPAGSVGASTPILAVVEVVARVRASPSARGLAPPTGASTDLGSVGLETVSDSDGAIIALLPLATAATEAIAVEEVFIKVTAAAVKESVTAALSSPVMPMPILTASMALAPATAPFVDDGADDMSTVGVDGFTTMVSTLEVGALDAPLEVSTRATLAPSVEALDWAPDAFAANWRELAAALARRVTGMASKGCCLKATGYWLFLRGNRDASLSLSTRKSGSFGATMYQYRYHQQQYHPPGCSVCVFSEKIKVKDRASLM